MLYIVVGVGAFWCGMVAMSLFAMCGSQEREAAFSRAWKAREERINELRQEVAMLRTVTLHDETGMAVEMPVEVGA